MPNSHQSKSDSNARIICREIRPTSIEELNTEMNRLIQNGYEPIKLTGIGEKDISNVCILLYKR